MNEEILNTFEQPARNYCAKIGIDPDEQLPAPGGTLVGVQNLVPQWHFVAMDLCDLSLKINALREAGGMKPPSVQ